MRPGTVIHDPSFDFHDSSEPGNKILIVLNDPSTLDNTYIVVKTTTNSDYKQESAGCNLEDRYPNYFIPQGHCFLKENTWVVLNIFYEFTYSEWLKKTFEERDVRTIDNLPKEILIALIICAKDSEDITLAQEKSLLATLELLNKNTEIDPV